MNDPLKEIIDENPKLKKMLLKLSSITKDPDGFIFPRELREKLAPLGKMDIRECFSNKEFMDILREYYKKSDTRAED